MEQNGVRSVGQKSRHINIRYFFIKDRVKSDCIDIVYYLTEHMIADFFTNHYKAISFEMFL